MFKYVLIIRYFGSEISSLPSHFLPEDIHVFQMSCQMWWVVGKRMGFKTAYTST